MADIYVAWQKAIRRILNLPYNTHRYLLPFVAVSSHIRFNLVNRFNNFFTALMSSDNKIIEIQVYNCHFSNTPLGLNRKWIYTIVINVMKSKKLMGHCFCHYWMFDAQIGLSLGFRKMRLNVWFIIYVSINLAMFMYLLNVWISTFPCPTVLYEWLIIVVFIFVYINMFIFLCILGSSESE